MTKILYVFWDSDNTLVETAEHHWRKHVEVLKTYGIVLDEKYRQKIYENNGNQNWEWISKELGLKADKQTYLDQIDAWYFDHMDELKIRDGVLEALKRFKKSKVKQCVVSNGRQKSVMSALNAKKLTDYFEFVFCKEDYEGRKPSPIPYQKALKYMASTLKVEIDPGNCLVIEDDPLGVQAGEAAGMMVLYRPVGDTKPIDMLVS